MSVIDDSCSIPYLQQRIREFAEARDWKQFHSPKNLVMAICGEVGELAEVFQWLTEEQSYLQGEKLMHAAEEIADIQIYLLRLADRMGIDILQAVVQKIDNNEKKYPPERVLGSAKKYSEYS